MTKALCCLSLSLLSFVVSNNAEPLVWENRSAIPGPGRHHPITFANESHAFYLTGSTAKSPFTNDFYMYDEAADTWTDLSSTTSAFPGKPRSFGYGVVLNEAGNTKAYLGFGAAMDGERLDDLWEFDMETHGWTQLANFIGPGRRHPAMVPVKKRGTDDEWEIHVGLGDGDTGNFNDWYSYDIDQNLWTQLPDFPSSRRHHPFFFGLGSSSYTGLGHSDGFDPYIERDWYRFEHANGWIREPDFASYSVEDTARVGPVTTEARVAGTEFSIELPLSDDSTTSTLAGSIGFVLSGDGDDHGTMETGEFHAFYPASSNGGKSFWSQLTPHPGPSRWAPGSFVMRGTTRAFFTSGYDRESKVLFNDLWMIDLSPLFATKNETLQSPGLVATEGSEPTQSPLQSPGLVATEGPEPTQTPESSTSGGMATLTLANCIIFGGAAIWALSL